MRFFIVEVSRQKIQIWETNNPLSVTHVSATVDGDSLVYKVIKRSGLKTRDVGKGWFWRGCNQAHYHAKNAGNIVRFNPVPKKPKKPKKLPERQKRMWGFE